MVLLSELSFLEYPILDKSQQPPPRFRRYCMQGHPYYDVYGMSVAVTWDKNNEGCQPHRWHWACLLHNYLHLNLLISYMNQVTCPLTWKFSNVVLDEDGEHRVDCIINEVSNRVKEERDIRHTIKLKKN